MSELVESAAVELEDLELSELVLLPSVLLELDDLFTVLLELAELKELGLDGLERLESELESELVDFAAVELDDFELSELVD